MNQIVIDYILTPDGTSSRRAKKVLATKAPGLYRIAGTWTELLSQAHSTYLLPPNDSLWSDKLSEYAVLQTDAFWIGSLEIAPLETQAELDVALKRLIEGAGPNADWPAFLKQLPQPSRLYNRLSQLCKLLKKIDSLPEPFQGMDDIINTGHSPLRALRVYHLPEFPTLSSWQKAVMVKLAKDAPPPDKKLLELLAQAFKSTKTSKSTLIAARSLYQPLADSAPPLDSSLRVLSARDRLEEVEVAAGILQKFIRGGGKVNQYGILLPKEEFTVQTVETVFRRYGLPLSGLERSMRHRDLGREVVRLMLLCLRRPAPIMSIAALLTSPMMPWSMEDGQDYAQAAMDGDVLLKKTKLDAKPRKLMNMLDEGADSIASLKKHLKSFRKLLNSGDRLLDHKQRALACVDDILFALQDMTETDWDRLLSKTQPEPLYSNEERVFWKEGITVFHEGLEPWRTVNHLLIIGFNEGHFPVDCRASAVLTEAEWENVALDGWAVQTAESERKQQRALFARQIASASDSLTILFSRRDADGKTLEPSSSLVFLARRFGTEPDELVFELSRREDRQKIPELATAAEEEPVPPPELPIKDIDLKVDLLSAFGSAPDNPASLSPSAAETLMVSPFAWLIGRLDCEPREWITDDLDPMTAGTLAHRVFEELFPAGRPFIDVKSIHKQVPSLLNQFTLQLAPFLRNTDWRVERLKLEAEIVRAAIRWRDLLASWRAEIIASEQWLKGHYNGISLRGQSDLLLQLPSGKLLVVDYKKSSSFKRRKRMRSRFDLQAHLYRLMIQSGGLPALESTLPDIGVVYYLLNDTTALSDSIIISDGTIPGLEVIDTDISSEAMQHLDRRLAEIRAGRILLNSTEDENWWDTHAGISIYALDNSPLLRLFMHDAEVSS